MVIREGALLAVAGILAGAAIGYSAGRIMRALLVGIPPGDALTFSMAIGLTILMTFIGSFIPALRAVHVNPATTMRAD
jgi:ABC-type antimicrobial peptide transport system permease subunit